MAVSEFRVLRNGLAAISMILVLAGCQSFNADLSYAKAAGLGYRNAGLYAAGYLFLWDKSTNQLTLLSDDVELERVSPTESPTTLTSTSVSGVSITGAFKTPAQEVAAELALGQKVSFTAEKAVRERYRSTISGLSAAYVKGLNEGQDMRSRWYVTDATRPNSSLRYVLVTSLVRANVARVEVGGLGGNCVGKLRLDVPGLGNIDVNVDRAGMADCSGDQVPCFFEPTVLKAYIAESGNLDFRVDTAADVTALSNAWRTLDR